MSNPPTVTSGSSASDADPANSTIKAEQSQEKTVKTEPTDADIGNDQKAATASTATTSSDGMEDDDDDLKSIKSEGADEEDALFATLEKNEEQEEAAHPHAQPKDAKAAPKLLQSALAKGDVSMDDSNSGVAVKEEEKKGEDAASDENSIVHQRVRICSIFGRKEKLDTVNNGPLS